MPWGCVAIFLDSPHGNFRIFWGGELLRRAKGYKATYRIRPKDERTTPIWRTSPKKQCGSVLRRTAPAWRIQHHSRFQTIRNMHIYTWAMRASTNLTGKGSEVRENLPSLKNCGGCGFEFFFACKNQHFFSESLRRGRWSKATNGFVPNRLEIKFPKVGNSNYSFPSCSALLWCSQMKFKFQNYSHSHAAFVVEIRIVASVWLTRGTIQIPASSRKTSWNSNLNYLWRVKPCHWPTFEFHFLLKKGRAREAFA